jgi:RNA polymerase sigma-70 factor (family 1)
LSASEKYSEDLRICVQQVAQGDARAFRQLYDYFHRDLYRFTLHMVKSDALAEDVVHDTFVKVWVGRIFLNDQLSIKSYLFTICRNLSLNLLEKAATEARLRDDILYHYQPDDSSYDEWAGQSEYESKLWKAIEALPNQRQAIFKMVKLDKRSYEDVAAELGISKGTVSDHVVKALRFLKKILTSA